MSLSPEQMEAYKMMILLSNEKRRPSDSPPKTRFNFIKKQAPLIRQGVGQ